MKLFLVECHYGEVTEEMTALRPTHRKYIEEMVNTGKIAAAGRATGNGSTSGVYIVPAETAEEAREVLAVDRFVVDGFVTHITVRRWALAFGTAGNYDAKALDPE
ncbi:YciI family protein [Corynebacterium sp. S7]